MDAGRVAVIGIGNMGWAIAERIAECGFTPIVRDIDPAREALAVERGFAVAASAAEAARGAANLIVTVVDATQTDAVLFGAAGAVETLPRGACVLLCPTIAPADVEHCAARLAAHGLSCLDAPMSGGPARARAGTMSLMVAGDGAVVDSQRGLLDAMASPVFRIGERVGDGARTKLVNNLLAAHQPGRCRRGAGAGRADRPRPGRHAGGDRTVERPELDRQRATAPCIER